jgi:hypothetical protein
MNARVEVAPVWQFLRNDGSVIAPVVRLLPDGRIEGHQHELAWCTPEGGILISRPRSNDFKRRDTDLLRQGWALPAPFRGAPSGQELADRCSCDGNSLFVAALQGLIRPSWMVP